MNYRTDTMNRVSEYLLSGPAVFSVVSVNCLVTAENSRTSASESIAGD